MNRSIDTLIVLKTISKGLKSDFLKFIGSAFTSCVNMLIDRCNCAGPGNNVSDAKSKGKASKTHLISRGSQSSLLESEILSFEDFEIDNVNGSSLCLSDFLTETDTDGFIVLSRGKIVYEYYEGTYTAKSAHTLMSMTKSIVGLVAGILVSQGTLTPDDFISTYVPEIIGTSFEACTIRDCLDMRLRFQYDDATPAYRKAAGAIPLTNERDATDLHAFLSTFQATPTVPIVGLKSGAFRYSSVTGDLMGWVLERASGKKFADLVSELLWQPMGAEDNANILVDRAGNVRTAGGMRATLRDVARVGQSMLDGDTGVIPASWIDDIISNGSSEAFDAGSWKGRFEELAPTVAYRSNWIVDQAAQILIGPGAFGQMMIVDRINQIVVVKFSSQPTIVDYDKRTLTIRAFRELQRILGERKIDMYSPPGQAPQTAQVHIAKEWRECEKTEHVEAEAQNRVCAPWYRKLRSSLRSSSCMALTCGMKTFQRIDADE